MVKCDSLAIENGRRLQSDSNKSLAPMASLEGVVQWINTTVFMTLSSRHSHCEIPFDPLMNVEQRSVDVDRIYVYSHKCRNRTQENIKM